MQRRRWLAWGRADEDGAIDLLSRPVWHRLRRLSLQPWRPWCRRCMRRGGLSVVLVDCPGASRPSEERHYQSKQRRLSIEGDGIGWSVGTVRGLAGRSSTCIQRMQQHVPSQPTYGYTVQPQGAGLSFRDGSKLRNTFARAVASPALSVELTAHCFQIPHPPSLHHLHHPSNLQITSPQGSRTD